MGNITAREILATISSLEMTLKELGLNVCLGDGVAAVEETYLVD